MRLGRVAFFIVFFSAAAFAQNARGVITGLVSDASGKAIGNLVIRAENPGTKIKYEAATTATGNYAFANLPAGNYVLSTEVSGFKPYTSEEVQASTAQIMRYDIVLEPEAVKQPKKDEEAEAEEEAEATPITELQRLESGQWAHIIEGATLGNSPLLGFKSGEGRIRNPLYALQLTPGTLMTNQQYFRINGAPGNTESIRIEGQDVGNGLRPSQTVMNQVGVDGVQEFTLQTSGYAAEYGQAGGGIVNMAMRSGTNDYHGSVYNYWAHEALNAQQPYTETKPVDRRYNYGATLGGPLTIPKNYDGRGRTYIFLNFEQFRQTNIYDQAFTVPTLAYRKGDFREALTGRKLGTDALGRDIMEGTIYNPASERVVNGKRVRDPFASNIISKTKLDPVAKAIQALIPLPTDTDNTTVVDNYVTPWSSPRLDSIGSFKVDQKFERSKLSFYFGINKETASQSADQGGDGFTTAVTSGKPTDIMAQTYQLNYERTMSPTRVLHVGLGYQGMTWRQGSGYGVFDQSKGLNLAGSNLSYFPYITGLLSAMGGMKDMGMNMQGVVKMVKPSGNANMTWVRGSHIFKFGAEVRMEGYPSTVENPAYGYLNFSADQTGLPSTFGQNLQGGTVGFAYASFFLGLVNNGNIGVVSNPRLGKHSFAAYAQDSWKVTRGLTVEYGLRYDYQTYLKDSHGRIGSFSPTALNPAAGNLLGNVIYEGSGAGHCNCSFAKNYPNAIGPRVGVAYQLSDNTILRAGFGVMYGQTATENGASLVSGSSNPFYSTVYDNAALKLSNGYPAAASWPDLNYGQKYLGSSVTPIAIHPDAGKPPRQIEWNLALQAQAFGGMKVEIAYVGNRGSSWQSNGLANLNAITTDRLKTFGLDITDEDTGANDRLLLASSINSSLALQRGFKAPYAGFPVTDTVAQSLRPFPQYGDILYRWAPLGKTWYDSAQLKVTRQYAVGLALNAGFSYQREYAAGFEDNGVITALQSVNNSADLAAGKHISSLSRPYTGFIAATYQFPKFAKNKNVSMALRDWTFSMILQYASGLPIHVPISNSNLYSLLFQTTYANRVNGAELYTDKINGNFDPKTSFILNPKAWTDPAAGEFSTSTAYYNDYRFRRRPSEEFSFGRTFQIREKIQLNVRIDFQNPFNRKEMADPVYSNAGATQVKNDDDVPQSGFGYVNYRILGGNQRNGQVVVRLLF
jgi:hypothetical protein